LITSAALAIVGLFFLSTAQGMAVIFVFATLYAFGKTFFWPTMLGVVSEQCPKGGALTLNAIAGIGMLTVGIIGGPLIGKMQEDSAKKALDADTYAKISVESSYFLGKYTAVDATKVETLGEDAAKETNEKIKVAKQGALANITVFPIFMLLCYIALAFYFKGRGGYQSVKLEGEDPKPAEGDVKA
ncbi:MAG: MFS transporter, partial [Verrucomicrobiia bacterium]